ncbi:hypothetical protein [Methylosarcina fibrata]|uniref:hypothetical protein n=1 Tax=Methylosarcina fibrata TaxID=105972 RepID=UPI00036322DC|nr:hypothetical protein [Methylosarcina fibrata]
MDRYLFHLLLSCCLLLGTAVAVNGLADPYGIFGTPLLKGINETKPAVATNRRIFKMVGYARQKMDALILGTSRADAGLSPKHEGFLGQRAVNLATPAQTNAETELIFKFVAERSDLKTAVVGLDFFASNAWLTAPDDFTPDNFAADRKWQLLLSFDTLLASGKSLFRPGKPPIRPDQTRENKPKKYSRQAFLASEKSYMWGGTYLPSPECRYAFEADRMERGKRYRSDPLSALRAIIALAHRRHVKLYLFISPSHARQWEVLGAVGLWSRWEEWKRRLVRINREEAERFEQAPFPLWDFSGYHSVSTEDLPEAGSRAGMLGYIDSSHYQPAVGDLVLDRLFNLKATGRALPGDFGVNLTPTTVEPHLAALRQAREHYRQSHPADIAEIEAMALQAKRESSCKEDGADLVALKKQ